VRRQASPYRRMTVWSHTIDETAVREKVQQRWWWTPGAGECKKWNPCTWTWALERRPRRLRFPPTGGPTNHHPFAWSFDGDDYDSTYVGGGRWREGQNDVVFTLSVDYFFPSLSDPLHDLCSHHGGMNE
jgi:hypothetical protein